MTVSVTAAVQYYTFIFTIVYNVQYKTLIACFIAVVVATHDGRAGDNEALPAAAGADVERGHDPHGPQVRTAGQRHVRRSLSLFCYFGFL